MFEIIHASGLKEPPTPLSVHFTIPIMLDVGSVVSLIVAVNVTGVPAVNVAGFGVMDAVVGWSTFAVNCDEPVLAW